MANNFNWRQRIIIEVPNQYVEQIGEKKLTQQTIGLLINDLSENFQVELNNNIITLKRAEELVGRIKQSKIRRAIENMPQAGQPRPRLRYHDVLDIMIEVANENDRIVVEDIVRQVLNIGPRLNLDDFPLEGTPSPGPALPNMNLEGGRKRRNRKTKKKNIKSKRQRVYHKTRRH
jgi:hypothetical protein